MREVALGGKTPPEKICRSKSLCQSRDRNNRLPDLCRLISRCSQVVFFPQAQPHAQSLFLFPIVFGINLIHFFDEKKDGAAGNSIVCFSVSIPCHAIWQKENEECELFRRVQRFLLPKAKRRMRTVSKGATFMATESANSAPFKRGERGANVWQRKSAKLFANTEGAHFWRGKV